MDFNAKVKRFTKIWVEAQDIDGTPMAFEAEDFYARVIQHEVDHLNGHLFIDWIRLPQAFPVQEETQKTITGGATERGLRLRSRLPL